MYNKPTSVAILIFYAEVPEVKLRAICIKVCLSNGFKFNLKSNNKSKPQSARSYYTKFTMNYHIITLRDLCALFVSLCGLAN